MSIDTIPSCQGFVGINESGKTNILKAIALLSSDIEITRNDVRIEGINEKRNQESKISYIFELSKDEMKMMIDELLGKIYFETSFPQINIGKRKISISDFFSDQNKGIYRCNINGELREARYYALRTSEIVQISGLKKKKKAVLESIHSKTGENIDLSLYDFVESCCIVENDDELFENCTTNDVNISLGNLIRVYAKTRRS